MSTARESRIIGAAVGATGGSDVDFSGFPRNFGTGYLEDRYLGKVLTFQTPGIFVQVTSDGRGCLRVSPGADYFQ